MEILLKYIDVVVSNEKDIEDIFGITSDEVDVDSGIVRTESGSPSQHASRTG